MKFQKILGLFLEKLLQFGIFGPRFGIFTNFNLATLQLTNCLVEGKIRHFYFHRSNILKSDEARVPDIVDQNC